MKRRTFIQIILGALASLFLPKTDHTIVQSAEQGPLEVDWQIVGESVHVTGPVRAIDSCDDDYAKVMNYMIHEEHKRLHRELNQIIWKGRHS